jgi:hypothetical protein
VALGDKCAEGDDGAASPPKNLAAQHMVQKYAGNNLFIPFFYEATKNG